MDFDHFALRSKGSSAEHLLQDDFKKLIHPRAIYSTGLASELVFDRHYIDERNAQFILSHKKSWARFISNLANWEYSSATIDIPRAKTRSDRSLAFPGGCDTF